MRKTPSEFQLTSFLVVQNNLTQQIQSHHDNLSAKTKQSLSKGGGTGPSTQGISPIKTSRKVANQTISSVNASASAAAETLNGKHSRSSANLDVAKISLTARVGPNDSPVIKRGAAAQSLSKAQQQAS